MNCVTSVRLPKEQINKFSNYINVQQGAALKVHTGFIVDLSKITTNLATSSEENTQTPPGPSNKHVNRPDLAKNCLQLTEDEDDEKTADFFSCFEIWSQAAYPETNDPNKKK